MGIVSSLARLRGPLGLAALGAGSGAIFSDPEDRLSGAMTGALMGGGAGIALAPVVAGASKAASRMLPPPARIANMAKQLGINPNTQAGAVALRRVLQGQTGSAATQFPTKAQAQLMKAVQKQYPMATHQQVTDHVLELMAGARDKVIEGVGDTAGMIGSGLSAGAGAVRRKAAQGISDTLGDAGGVLDSAGALGGKVVDAAADGVNKVGDGVRSVIKKNAGTVALGAGIGGGGYMLMKANENKGMEQQGRYNMLKEVGLPPNAVGLAMLRQKHGALPPKPDMAFGDPGFTNDDMMLLAQEMNAKMAQEKAPAAPRPKAKR